MNILGEVKATPAERIAQSLNSNQKEFFLRIAPANMIIKIESNLTREKALGGEAVTITPTWEMTIEEAQQYLIDQQGEVNFYTAIVGDLEEKDEGFTEEWIKMVEEDPYKTVGHKGSYYTEDEKGNPIEEYYMYIITNSWVKRNATKVFTPNSILITPANFTPKELRERIDEIIKERKEYAGSQTELSDI